MCVGLCMGMVLGDEAELCVSDYVWAWYLVMRLNHVCRTMYGLGTW